MTGSLELINARLSWLPLLFTQTTAHITAMALQSTAGRDAQIQAIRHDTVRYDTIHTEIALKN